MAETNSSSAEDEVLSDLAHKLVDQVALYGLARNMTTNAKVAEAIQRAKDDRANLLQDINAKIYLNGIAAIDQGTKLGTAHKAFSRLQDVTEDHDRAAISEVQRGEDYLIERVGRLSEDERLAAHTRNYLQTVISRLTRTRDDIIEAKESAFGQ